MILHRRFLPIVFTSVLAVSGCAAEHHERAEPSSQGVTAEGPSAGGRAAPSFEWPTPEGWRTETIPFPLGFAPELAYRGVEELRFAPRFFDPKAETYFSYSFVWLLEDAPALDAERVAHDLDVYFTGLARAVAPAKFDPDAHDARVETSADGAFRGIVHTVDAFGDGRALTLAVAGEPVSCGAHKGILLSLSPRPAGDPVWTALTAQRRTFRCPG